MSSQKDGFTTVQNGAFSSPSGSDLQGFFIPTISVGNYYQKKRYLHQQWFV